MRPDVARLNPEDLAAVVQEGEARLEEVRAAIERLPRACDELQAAVDTKTCAQGRIRGLREEIARLQETIKPKRRRKAAAAAPAEAPDDSQCPTESA